jgi:hypothetical protein
LVFLSKKYKGGEQYKQKGVLKLKKKNWMFLISILLFGIFSSCQPDLPNPKTKYLSFMNKRIASASNQIVTEKPSLVVHYLTKGDNLFVECIVTGITFREMDQSQQRIGKMIVWLDGKKKQEVSAAAFIMKGLSNGNHQLRLEVVNLQNKPYGLSKEFNINIHKD